MYVWATLLELHYVTLLVFAGLYYCVYVTRDYRLRAKLYEATAELESDDLYAQFRHAMWIAGLYAAKPYWPVVPHRNAAVAIVLATVLRERIFLKAGLSPPRSYLRHRSLLIRQAKTYARLHAGRVEL